VAWSWRRFKAARLVQLAGAKCALSAHLTEADAIDVIQKVWGHNGPDRQRADPLRDLRRLLGQPVR
jgi:hypothetical protein